jgi:hypothetical protein
MTDEEWASAMPLIAQSGTNPEVFGYGGQATGWQTRAFGAAAFPLPIRHVLVAPAFEADQEPHPVAVF